MKFLPPKKFYAFLRYYGAGILLAVIMAAEAYILLFSSGGYLSNDEAIRKYGMELLRKCADEEYRRFCYDKHIPELMDTISFEDAFEVVKFVRGEDKYYNYCHVVGHRIAEREIAKNPEQWMDVIPRCPRDQCSYGCVHGAFQAYFRQDHPQDRDIETVIPLMQGICTPGKHGVMTETDLISCFHAVGHGAMYVTSGDIKKSLAICDRVATKGLWRCYEGAFMQLYYPPEEEDRALVAGKQPPASEIREFCAQFTGDKKSTCWWEAWLFFYDQMRTPDGLVQYCSFVDEGKSRDLCFNALFSIIAADVNLDQPKILDFCSRLPQDLRGRCAGFSAGYIIYVDPDQTARANALCEASAAFGGKRKCYEILLVQYHNQNTSVR